MSRWLVVGFVCCALSLVFPPIGGVAFVIGVVALVRKHIQAGAILVVLGVLVPIAGTVVVQAFFVRAYRLPSESMQPTLDLGDRFVAWRAGGAPHVGDIVVFHPPTGAESANECGARTLAGQACPRPTRERADVTFVKRIVAGPGDSLAIIHGGVVVDGKPRTESFTKPCGTADCDFPKPITIPPDHWFMMGDNRGASDDSRYWGPVPSDWIVGRAFFRYWPPDRAGGL